MFMIRLAFFELHLLVVTSAGMAGCREEHVILVEKLRWVGINFIKYLHVTHTSNYFFQRARWGCQHRSWPLHWEMKTPVGYLWDKHPANPSTKRKVVIVIVELNVDWPSDLVANLLEVYCAHDDATAPNIMHLAGGNLFGYGNMLQLSNKIPDQISTIQWIQGENVCGIVNHYQLLLQTNCSATSAILVGQVLDK
ncbi:hypothetical protein BKA82DRAFT_4010623 [Pisolithus tinctorius]|nr:hypothetical protein BKA82DRAFT_4010623 [Pisolithus tinctorius]